jgi:hypothetical protein
MFLVFLFLLVIAKGSTDEFCLFPKEWIPDVFLKEFCNASKLFAERQRLAIKSNLRYNVNKKIIN